MGMFGRSRSSGADVGSSNDDQYGFREAFLGNPLGLGLSDEEKKHLSDEQWIDATQEVYHYTTLAGMMGIIESGGLWATDNRFLNDSEEVTHGIEIATKILGQNVKTATSPSWRRVLDSTIEQIQETLGRGSLIICFSLAKDSLEQWRAYGYGNGICLRFDTRATGCLPIFRIPFMIRRRVFYDDKLKERFVLRKILRFLEAFLKDEAKYGSLTASIEHSYSTYLAMSMANAIAVFKNEAFRSEQEVRVVISLEDAREYDNGIQFRLSQYGPIAYVNTASFKRPSGLMGGFFTDEMLDSGTGLLPLSSVVVGPSPHQGLVAQSVSAFLNEKRYRNVPVETSTVSLRVQR